MIAIKLVDARRGLNIKCRELFKDEKIAESIYRYLCDGIEECDDVEPERKHGEWINISISANGVDSTAECDLCGAIVHNNFSSNINYCPNCGAHMVERKDDEQV